MNTTRTQLTVRYAETDAQGVVHHSSYLIWFEEGRSDYIRQMGLNYSDFERDGYYVVVVEANLTYRAPALYEDRVTIETTLSRGGARILEFTYRALNQHGTLLVEGRTLHLILDSQRRPVALPEAIVGRLLSR